jgi:hypothetical protein
MGEETILSYLTRDLLLAFKNTSLGNLEPTGIVPNTPFKFQDIREQLGDIRGQL